jgi:sec-independent protein translocase protein TatC
VSTSAENRVPFINHIAELRTRLMWSVASIVAGAVFGYFVRGYLISAVQKPLGETLYYTDPTGALSFVIKICVVFGILFGLPVVMYHVFGFLGPLLSKRTKSMTAMFTFFSVILAISGALFAYYFTLPAALEFLVGFGSESIKSLITADEYFNFAFAYILGFALLFQIPLMMLFINRIKPLPPRKLFGALRYVLVISFVIAAIITPTPDPLNQALMALPAVLLYLVTAVVLAIINHPKKKYQENQELYYVSLPKAALPLLIRQPQQSQLSISQPVMRPSAPRDVLLRRRTISDFV